MFRLIMLVHQKVDVIKKVLGDWYFELFNETNLNYVNVFQSVHCVFTYEVLYVNDIFMVEGEQNPHFTQGSLKRKVG